MAEVPTSREDVRRAFKSLEVDLPDDVTPEQFLGIVRNLMSRYGEADAEKALRGVTVKPVDAGGIPAEYLVPDVARTDLRIVFLHGGAWIGGGYPAYRPLGAVLAKSAGCPVLVVDYRLAPENPYPAPLDDCVAAFEWACDNGPDGPGSARVCVGGDSAGGNLTATLCIRQIMQGRRLPDRVALLCGTLDLQQDDYVARHDPLSSPTAVRGSYEGYTHGLTPIDDPLVSPINASMAVFEQFPPALIQASTDEFLVEGSRRFATKLIAAGRRSILSTWPLMPHSWHCFLDMLPEAQGALDEVAEFFKR